MLDTRLKNNKKALRTAAILVITAAAIFAWFAASYKDRVDNYYAETGNGFEQEDFIEILFQSNYVLYPEVLEKSGKDAQLEELYLTFSQEPIEKVERDNYVGNEAEYMGNGEQLKTYMIEKLNRNVSRVNDHYVSNLAMNLDYCVIDETTQTILKNTAREPELLKDGDNSIYTYYLVLYYDKNGRISNIKVGGSNVEQFLKNVQLVANSKDTLLLNDYEKVSHYVLVDEDNMANGKMTVTQKNPQDVVFIYAMTEEQKEQFPWIQVFTSSSEWVIGVYDRQFTYRLLGIGNLYLTILGIITILFFIIARCKSQLTADTAGSRFSAELIFLVLGILSIGLNTTVVELVYYFSEVVGTSEEGVFFIIFVAMVILFGAWYWGLLSVRELFSGFLPFLRKRSLIYRYWNEIKGFCRHILEKWKAAMSIEGLNKDVINPLKRIIIFQLIVTSLLSCFWFVGIFGLILYSLLLYLVLKRYLSKIQTQYNSLLNATNAIAQGRFDNKLAEDFGIFESYKNELYQIQNGFGKAVDEEVRSQRMKTELITNVSHDLKTPLTAIITYVDLLKEENVTPEQRKSYLNTLERKSLRLKVLIEDLFEISKASSGNVRLELVAVDICNLMRQVYLEHEDQMIKNGLDMRFDIPEEKIILQLDSQKTYRIFENLYINVMKYALPNTRVYVLARVIIIKEGQRTIHIEMKNISAQELTVTPTDLTERFVRGDVSRNTEGSGLGLAIAKSFSELQGGRFYVEIDGDLFKAVLEWDT